jgi:sulfite exporter TauE/SafE
VVVAAALGALAGVAAGAGSVVVAAVAGLALAALTLRALVECGTATTAIRRIARRVAADEPAA